MQHPEVPDVPSLLKAKAAAELRSHYNIPAPKKNNNYQNQEARSLEFQASHPRVPDVPEFLTKSHAKQLENDVSPAIAAQEQQQQGQTSSGAYGNTICL